MKEKISVKRNCHLMCSIEYIKSQIATVWSAWSILLTNWQMKGSLHFKVTGSTKGAIACVVVFQGPGTNLDNVVEVHFAVLTKLLETRGTCSDWILSQIFPPLTTFLVKEKTSYLP